MNFISLSSYIFGLDIGDLSFKIALLKKKGGKIELKIYGEKSVPRDYFLKGEVSKEKEVARFVKDFVEESKIHTPYVIAVLPETRTFIKTIEIPYSEDILGDIKKEIELNIPFKIEEVYFDWQKFSQDGKLKILIGVAPKGIVDSYIKILKMADLKPVALEIESIAILRALFSKKEELSKPKIILDLGATRSSLIIIDDGIIQLTISLPFSGQSLTEEIASKLKMNFEMAEKSKKNYSEKDKNSELENIILFFLNNLATALKSHIGFYEEGSEKKIEEIILCGGGANLYRINSFLEEKLKIKVKKGNPLVNISKKNSSLTEDTSLLYTTAIGLALRGLEERI